MLYALAAVPFGLLVVISLCRAAARGEELAARDLRLLRCDMPEHDRVTLDAIEFAESDALLAQLEGGESC